MKNKKRQIHKLHSYYTLITKSLLLSKKKKEKRKKRTAYFPLFHCLHERSNKTIKEKKDLST